MKRNKKGEIEFDSATEASNYIDAEYTVDKIRERAKNREKSYNYENKDERRAALLSISNRIKDKEAKKVYCFIVDATTKGVPYNDVINYLAYKALKVKPQAVIELEQKAKDQIKSSLEIIHPGTTFGENGLIL